MKKREYGDFIQDIFDCIVDVEDFTQGMEFDSFRKDRKTTFAVVRAVEVIGEATKNIPKAIRNKYPDVPWKKMAGIRDRLAHAYFGTDLEILWGVVRKDLPTLKPLIQKMLKDFD